MASPTLKYVQDAQEGSQVVSIDDFLDQPEKKIITDPFPMAGYMWRLLVYPHGDPDSKGYVSVFVQLAQSTEEPVRAKFHIYRCRTAFEADLLNVKASLSM